MLQTDQHNSASASDLVLFGGNDEEMADDSMSLAASDAEELSDSVTDAALLPSSAPSAAGWMPNFSVSSQNWLKSWDWSGLHQKSPLAAVWTRGSCWVAVRPLANDPRRSSAKFTTSSRDHGTPPTLLTSILPLHSPSLQLTSLKKRSVRRCLFWMSQWLHTFAHPLLSAGRQRPPIRPTPSLRHC